METTSRLVRKEFLDFSEARNFARSLQLRELTEWEQYCKSGKRSSHNSCLAAFNTLIPRPRLTMYSPNCIRHPVGDYSFGWYIGSANSTHGDDTSFEGPTHRMMTIVNIGSAVVTNLTINLWTSDPGGGEMVRNSKRYFFPQ